MGIDYQKYSILLSKTLNAMKSIYGRDLLSVALFGSVARGEAGPTSDIDLLVVTKKLPYEPMQKFLEVLRILQKDPEFIKLRKEGLWPDPYPLFLNEEELNKRALILLDILDHGIILYDEHGFLKEALDRLKKKLKALGSKKITLPDGTWYWDLKPDWKPGEIIEL